MRMELQDKILNKFGWREEQGLSGGWKFKARFWINLVGFGSKICHEGGALTL
jgi:hypothetical protein